MTQLALGLGGAFVGNLLLPGIGGQIGFGIGAFIGGRLVAEDIDQVAPTIEGEITSSSYGATLPRVWGVFPVSGNIIDASEIRKKSTKVDVGGKGEPSASTTTHTYFADIDVAIHDGPIDAVLQIRANGRVIYDASPDAEVVREDWLQFTLYPGSEDQGADPVFQAIRGVNNVPAYLGTAHIVFEDFALSEFGMAEQVRIAFEFVIATSASQTLTPTAIQATGVGEDASPGGAIVEPATGLVCFAMSRASGTTTYNVVAVDPYSRAIVWRTAFDGLRNYKWIQPWPLSVTSNGITTILASDIVCQANNPGVAGYLVRLDGTSGVIKDTSDPKITGVAGFEGLAVPFWAAAGQHNEPYYVLNRGSFAGHDLFYGFDDKVQVDPPEGWFIGAAFIASNGVGQLLVQIDNNFNFPTIQGSAVYDVIAEAWSPVMTTVRPLATAWTGETWWVVTGSDTLAEIDNGGTVLNTVDLLIDYGISESILLGTAVGSANGLLYDAGANDLIFHGQTKVYRLNVGDLSQAPVARSITTPGVPGVFHAPTCRVWYNIDWSGANEFIYHVNLCAATGDPITLDVPVAAIATDGTALGAGDIDVTALAAVSFRGTGISRALARRNLLAVLQQAYLFDFVPRAGKLTAMLRGQATSATLDADLLGAHIDGAEAPAPWTITRAAGNTLPRQVEVDFIDPAHNYERSTQLARRLVGDLGTVERLQLAVVLTNDEAAELVDTLLHLRHIGGEAYQTTAMPSTIDDVQPGNVIDVDFEGGSYRARVLDGSIVDGRVIAVRAEREIAEAFASFAVGGVPRTPGSTVRALGATLLWPLDLPLLRDVDNDAGVYLAATSYTPGWPGADISRSIDGVEYAAVFAVTRAATMGNVTNAPTTGAPGRFDHATTLTVTLIDGVLVSGTRAAPLYFAWGQNGRFEICAATTATQNADGTWSVSEIARGLLDTGHAISQHAVADRFVVLEVDALARLVYSLSSIGQDEYLQAVTLGRTVNSATTVSLQFEGEALEPFAPCRLDAQLDGSFNWDLSWVRQDRIKNRPLWSPPNSEATETYTLQILDEEGNVVRTETIVDATTFEYTVAMQTADFGGTQDLISWQVAQVSANTGDGHFASAASGIVFDYVGATVDKSPLLFVRFEETTGTTAAVLVGSFDGSYVGSPTLGVAGLLPTGVALQLSGSGQYVQFPYDGSWTNDAVNAVEITFNADALPAAIMTLVHSSFPTTFFSAFALGFTSAGQLRFRGVRAGGTVGIDHTGPATLSAGTDYHVIVNFDYGASDGGEIYVNGSLYTSWTNTVFWNGSFGVGFDFYVGHSPSLSWTDFDGVIDDVVVYDFELSAAQRLDQYNRSGIT